MNVADVRAIKCLVLLPDSSLLLLFFLSFWTMGCQQAGLDFKHVINKAGFKSSGVYVLVLHLDLDTVVMKAGFG